MATITTFTKVAGLNKALRKLPKNAQARLVQASGDIAATEADRAAGKAYAVGGVAALVAPSVRSSKGKVPTVKMGGTRLLPPRNGRKRRGLRMNVDAGELNSKRQTIGDVMWGAEFGGSRPETDQFKPWRGNGANSGYFLWPTIRHDSDAIDERYSKALLSALKDTK